MKKRKGAAMMMANARNTFGICASVDELRLQWTHISEGEGEGGGEDDGEEVACCLEGHCEWWWTAIRCCGVS